VAIFVDGGFWHGHPSKYWPGRSGLYWDAKIAKNILRDLQTNADLAALDWTVIRIWDFELMKHPLHAAEVIMERLADETRSLTPRCSPAAPV